MSFNIFFAVFLCLMVLYGRGEDDWFVTPFFRLRGIVKHEYS